MVFLNVFMWLMFFTTDHYLYNLNCKQNCAVELASTAGTDKPFEDFLPSHFNYLQFSYYNSTIKFHIIPPFISIFLFIFLPNFPVKQTSRRRLMWISFCKFGQSQII